MNKNLEIEIIVRVKNGEQYAEDCMKEIHGVVFFDEINADGKTFLKCNDDAIEIKFANTGCEGLIRNWAAKGIIREFALNAKQYMVDTYIKRKRLINNEYEGVEISDEGTCS